MSKSVFAETTEQGWRHAYAQRKRPVVQIRKQVYRGRVGFLVVECGGKGFGARIFTETRTSAERIREKVRRGEHTTLEDFQP